jgi:hypothetical protein
MSDIRVQRQDASAGRQAFASSADIRESREHRKDTETRRPRFPGR